MVLHLKLSIPTAFKDFDALSKETTHRRRLRREEKANVGRSKGVNRDIAQSLPNFNNAPLNVGSTILAWKVLVNQNGTTGLRKRREFRPVEVLSRTFSPERY